MLSYGGILLSVPPPDLVEHFRGRLDWSWVEEWTERTWPGRDLTDLGFRPWLRRTGPVVLGRLSWPWSASRWAVGHYAATDDQLGQIRTLAYSGNTLVPLPLVVADGAGSITTNLSMLPPRPLSPVGGRRLWLLTLVDDRFFWWFKSADVTVSAGVTSWATLYASIGTALGVTITVDTIPAAYLSPPAAAQSRYNALPTLLDAVAASCGQRIGRGLDGTVRAWNNTNALTQVTTNAAVNAIAAGGPLALTP